MKITLLQKDIARVDADGLVLPVDGQVCAIGGTAAAKALKTSSTHEVESVEEQGELYVAVEEEIARIKPLRHGYAKVIEGNETWGHLVVAAAFYHHVNDTVFSPQQASALLTSAVRNTAEESVKNGLQSIAMTLMGNTYRLSARESIMAIMKGLASTQAEFIEVKWCILRDEYFRYAKQLLDSL
ncbi:hypothetical protein [uncultured Desulfobulbus sp.]|uniref:hypothetical protein n=1 Tax=uncultured Desulfobulbus sp. TaxID=239745 RepID=UPI0029C6D889|nr:hypothetical protein [uncultured Desulfobulbus sp.]